MICPNCRHENVAAAKFCLECGTRLRAICPRCGAELPPTAKFCHECGAALAAPATPAESPSLEAQFVSLQQALPSSVRDHLLTPVEGENRLVTVLFGDMSRSVQTTAELPPDEAAALVNELLKAMVDVLLKYEGRVDRFLGDGVLAVFGTPQAHESDPERAIGAALEIREAARRLGLEVTAGINTGEVYVGGIGSERHQEVTVMGPIVNLASRLQGQAEPGQILVGEATYRLTRRAFAFTPLSLAVKGIAEPVAAYAVERALPRPEKARGIEGLRAELIGRDEEFTRLREALTELQSGRGQIVTLIGEAGVGKSRLVSELKQLACASTETGLIPLWLEGRCLELGMGAGYWLFVDLFREHFAFAPDDDERAQGERLVAALKDLVERGDLSRERFEEIGPLLGNLMSVRFSNEWGERLKNASPEQIKHQTFLAIRDYFVALARRQPLLLVCEDLHWADSLSLDVIALLMETLTLARLMLLCVFRPERERKCWHLGTIASRKCADRYTEIHLRELTPPQSRRLVESLLTIENLPASVKELILEKSRGNPFFVEEVVRSLIASGMVYQTEEVWRAREGIESVTVPESVQSVILSRVDRLERELRGVLESASVIGRLFRRRLLEHTMRGTSELERVLWELEDHALIYQERVVPEEEFSFKHVMTQETIYGSIVRRRRAAFHQKVAEAMEALYGEGLEQYYEQLAYHYERSGVDEKAVEYLLKAGEKTRLAYLNEVAIDYFQRALARLERCSGTAPVAATWRLAALQGLGQTYHGIGKEVEAEERFRQAIALGREAGLSTTEIVRLYFWLGETLFWRSNYEEMMRVGEEGRALLAEDSQSVEAALMNQIIAIADLMQGGREKWQEFTSRNAAFLERLPYSEELRPAYMHLVILCAQDLKNPEEATHWAQALARRAEQHHDRRALAGAIHFTASYILGPTGDLRGSLAELRRALELYARMGDTKHEAQCLQPMSSCLLSLGDLEGAATSAERQRALVETVGNRSFLAWSHLRLGTVALCRGAWDEAANAFQQSARLFGEVHGGGEAWAVLALGRVSLAQGERLEAQRYLEQAAVLAKARPLLLAIALNGLEEAYEDPEVFQDFCRRFREEHPGAGTSALAQWYLRPATHSVAQLAVPVCSILVREEFQPPLSPAWVWEDPLGDCSFILRDGMILHAVNGRDLWGINLSSPRLLQPVESEFGAQTVCCPVSAEKPALGGLLVWRSRQSYLRLDRGTHGRHEICFHGCLENKDMVFGRGRLPAERVFLRLERREGLVKALCSADGVQWFTVGQVEFPVEGSAMVGLHAIGDIDRVNYPAAYPEGTAIRFESFELWMKESTGEDARGDRRKRKAGEAGH